MLIWLMLRKNLTIQHVAWPVSVQRAQRLLSSKNSSEAPLCSAESSLLKF